MRLLASLLACVLALLVGCDGGAELNVVAEAAERTERASSLRYELESTTDPGTPEELTMLGAGVVHPEAQRSWRRWAPEGGVFPDEDPEVACPDDRNEVIETPSTWYLLSPPFSACEPLWFELDMPALREQGIDVTAADLLGIESVPTMEPLDALAYLRRAPGEVNEVGSEQVRGDETTRYRLVTTGEQDEEIDVWVDAAGHVRRIRFEGDLVATLELFAVGSAPLPPAHPEGETRPGNWIVELYAGATEDE